MSSARLISIADGLYAADHTVVLPIGARFPTRMTVARLASGGLWLPVPIDDALADELGRLGPVTEIVAPNAFHHLYVSDASKRYPEARIRISPALRKKRPDLAGAVDLESGPSSMHGGEIEPLSIDGVPGVGEFVFWHAPSRSLIVSDLLFNIREPMNFATRLTLKLSGTYDRLGQSRMWDFMAKNKQAARVSFDRIAEKPFERVIVAHGPIVNGSGAQRAVFEASTRIGPS